MEATLSNNQCTSSYIATKRNTTFNYNIHSWKVNFSVNFTVSYVNFFYSMSSLITQAVFRKWWHTSPGWVYSTSRVVLLMPGLVTCSTSLLFLSKINTAAYDKNTSAFSSVSWNSSSNFLVNKLKNFAKDAFNSLFNEISLRLVILVPCHKSIPSGQLIAKCVTSSFLHNVQKCLLWDSLQPSTLHIL